MSKRVYDQDRNGLVGYQGLAVAIVIQAAEDWRWLSEGNSEAHDRSFAELEEFFRNEAKMYLSCSVMKASQMLKILLREKSEKYCLDRRYTV